MSDRLTLKYVYAALLIAAGVGTSFPAQAGFQWVAPGDSVSAPPMGTPVTNSVQVNPSFASAASTPEIISPVVITGNPVAAAPVLAAPVPLAPAPQVVAAAPVALAPAPAPAPVDNSVVVGFARSVPLAVALRQILPAGYTFAIDQDVDMGTLVSFQGGRPWRDTLRDTLDPVGLVSRERGQMIEVSAAAHVMAAPAPVAVVPAVQPVAPAYQMGMAPRNLMPVAPAVVAPAPAIVATGPAPAISILPPSTITAVVPVAPMAPATGNLAFISPAPAPAPMPIAPSAPVIAPAPDLSGVTDSWTAERGETLRKVLENWSRRANVEFDWLSEYDYPLQASVAFSGGFEGAVRSLLTGFEAAHPQPVAELHSNPNLGQMVLVVQTRGNTNSD